MDLCIISTLCFGMFSYLSAPLVLVIFCNPSIRTHVFRKSDGSKIRTFSTCFVGFVPSLFFLRFSLIFDAIWGSIWHQLWEKNRSENRSKKRRPPRTQIRDYALARRLPDSPLACALLKQETIARARNVVRIRVHASGFEKLLENGCLSWLRLQMFQNKSKKWKGSMYYPEGFAPDDLTRPGQRPGEFSQFAVSHVFTILYSLRNKHSQNWNFTGGLSQIMFCRNPTHEHQEADYTL